MSCRNINLSKGEGEREGDKSEVATVLKRRSLFSLLSRVNSTVDLNRGGGWERKEQVLMTRIRIGHPNINCTLNVIGKHYNARSVNNQKQYNIFLCHAGDIQQREREREREAEGEGEREG